jgi:hypothetical protein
MRDFAALVMSLDVETGVEVKLAVASVAHRPPTQNFVSEAAHLCELHDAHDNSSDDAPETRPNEYLPP